MFTAFRTAKVEVVRTPKNCNDEPKTVDNFCVGDEDEMKAKYAEFLEMDDTYCAGFAEIKDGTEPHWVEE